MNNSTSAALSRRQFLSNSARLAAGSTLLGTVGSFQRAFAATADTSGYKALVCLYMAGGNDGFNTIVPRTATGYTTYAATRRSLALTQTELLPLNGVASDGNAYGFNPSCADLQTLFNNGNMAILGNVGTLVQPTSVAQAKAGTVTLPLQLFSHIDQQTAWWTSIPDQAARFGWAGRVADLYNAQGYTPRIAMNINIGGVNYWQEGRQAMPYVLGPGGAPVLLASNDPYRSGLRQQATKDLLAQAGNDSNLMVAELARIQNNAAAKVSIVNSALSAAGDVKTAFPSYPGDSNLGAQLHEVARCIKAQAQIGDSRQMFFVNIGGFDTHNNEKALQSAQLSIVSKNVGSFWAALNEIGAQNNVTLFTASDFGRTLTTDGDGADHAWGNHHFIVGGAVRAGYYGKMPSLILNGPDDLGAGRIVPTTSTDQYAATLSRWFGVPDAELDGLFPNLANFASRDLGFLG